MRYIFAQLLTSFLGYGVLLLTSGACPAKTLRLRRRQTGASLISTPSATSTTVATASATPSSSTPVDMSGSANDNIVYIGSSVDNHYRNVAAARKNGFRPLSFSICNISTTSDTAAISAAWTKATGPTWEISNITTLQGMSEFVDQLAGQGFVPTILAAAGSAANPFFIAVAEKIPGGYLANFAMSGVSTDSAPLVRPGSIQDINLQAQNRSLAPHAVAVYGSGSSVSYAAVWLPNPDFDKYHLRVADSKDEFSNIYDEETSLPGFHLHQASVTDEEIYVSIFSNTYVGDCEFKDGLTKSQILRGQVIKGKPISVVSRGQGDQIRYGLISSSVGAVVPRVWNEDHSGADLSQLEGTLRPFMTRNGIRFAQLALYSRGTEIARSSYSWTEPDRTDIKDLGNSGQFLLAGQSRSFVGAVVQAIIDDGIITLDSPAYGLISGLPTPADFRADQITIGQLLNSTSGYGESTHPENIMRSISSAVGNLRTSSVLERLGYVSYVYSRVKLDYDPGTRVYDSNYNWDLLAEICQKVTGTGFYSFLRDRVLDPEKLNVTQFATIPGGNAQDPETATGGNQSEQVVLEDDHLGPSAYNLLNNRLVPYTQSGNGMILEVSIGSTGLAGNAASVAKFLGSNALAGAGPRIGGVSRLSTVAGALSYAESRRDGKDWCLLMNSQNFKGDADPQSQLVDPINDFFTGVNTNVATT